MDDVYKYNLGYCEYGNYANTDRCYDLKLFRKKLLKSLNKLERKVWRSLFEGVALRDVCRTVGISLGTAHNLKHSIQNKARALSRDYTFAYAWQGEGNGKKTAPIDD